jgi:hypothetical protein
MSTYMYRAQRGRAVLEMQNDDRNDVTPEYFILDAENEFDCY